MMRWEEKVNMKYNLENEIDPLISVVIPAYNVEDYIGRCLDSIINQTYENLEIIVVDDGSIDKTKDIIKEYSNSDKRIISIYKQNGGLSSARNAALDICKGDFITFVDSDDIIVLDCIEYLFKLSKDNQSDISVIQLEMTYDLEQKSCKETSESIFVLSAHEAIENMLYGQDVGTHACGKLFMRNIFDKIRFPLGMLFEDLATMYKTLMDSTSICVSKKKMYLYLQRENSIISKSFSSEKMDLIKAVDMIENDVLPIYPDLYTAIVSRKFNSAIYLLLSIESREYDFEKQVLKQILAQTRKCVILDKKSGIKRRTAALFSYLGITTVKVIFNLVRNLG